MNSTKGRGRRLGTKENDIDVYWELAQIHHSMAKSLDPQVERGPKLIHDVDTVKYLYWQLLSTFNREHSCINNVHDNIQAHAIGTNVRG